MSVTIHYTTKTYPRADYKLIKQAVLGKRYELTLVFLGPKRAAALNQTSRGKSYIPNVLSFPLDAQSGEIYITPSVAKKEARQYGLSYEEYVRYLFIHGLLHLKGLDHGYLMETAEARLMRRFKNH